MIIRWTNLANESFEDEVDFILKKWNAEEALNFSILVEEFLILVEKNPYLGKISDYKNYRQFVLSTQTKIWYKVDEKLETIHIFLFRNNKKYQIDLTKYLK